MRARNDGGPAYPMPDLLLQQAIDALESAQIPEAQRVQLAEQLGERAGGLSMRDYFAIHEPIDPNESIGQKLAEALTRRTVPIKADRTFDPVEVALFWAEAEAAYRYLRADAMLRAREA